ncbi:hypothetical protein IU436_16610 [Nocardia farcinica]|uniref:Uncharacterized protein n=1 Tax=Nocardia farcinica TaxID=37329 RepID=A0A0H5NR74_NOCFR|nr:hypothetical protein [Nocardia farcinica]AXK85711.1 hypothetical protein DXT66_08775 [Nocardia farcinica]MBA4855276.1 hypothetical protein [Nocardia farcinica]MBC9817729.1 hypothetical protein [Nocardia farcinica]MBF6260067.1 hypothetical protein [Nocardia farcinica]MBF6361597.1 hypothetical protein [Nocardia farcinica]
MRRYYVKVHCCGPHWLIHVPAVDRWTVTTDKKSIRSAARHMIAAATGRDATSFELDLVAGRAVRDADEFAVGSTLLRRWDPSPDDLGRQPPVS